MIFNSACCWLTDEEYQAVYEWITREKDRLSSPLKEGLLKLVNEEGRRRLVDRERDNQPGGTQQD